jgi:hypothetical protein
MPPQTHMTVDACGGGEHYVYEGEALMTQAQQDRFQQVVGNGLSRVSVSRDFSEKDYGNGGGVSVTVSLTCDQSENGVNPAIVLANEIALGWAWHYHQQLKQQLIQAGILKGP